MADLGPLPVSIPGGDAFQAPGGIPDVRNATAAAPDGGLGAGIAELLQSGVMSPEELLQLVAALAGIGGGAPQAPPPNVGSIEQAFAGGGGGAPGGGAGLQIPGLPL